jgi:hypothetical protein
MAVPNLDEINTLTTKKIMPGLVDNFFKNSPLLAFVKNNRRGDWAGGPTIQENFLYKPMKGGAYAKGATFDITKRQTMAGLLFEPKFYQVNVTEFTEDVEIIVRGPQAVLSLVQAHLSDAALTMSGILAIAIYRHGQNLVGDDRSLQINGLEEALSDGAAASFGGGTFTSYGQQARADVNNALNSPTGLIAANINGAITYHTLEHTYQSCVIGSEHPVIGVTTNRCMGYINENFQPQQRIDSKEPTIGFTGIKFKDATIVQDQYCPGVDGVDDEDLGDYSNSTGETFFWLNPGGEGEGAYFRLFIATSPKYQFGFTGFKVAQDSTVVAGQILFGGNFTVRAPRLMRILHNITG